MREFLEVRVKHGIILDGFNFLFYELLNHILVILLINARHDGPVHHMSVIVVHNVIEVAFELILIPVVALSKQ